jgi:pimeloyl-ACP methyl ester carboxylesterase
MLAALGVVFLAVGALVHFSIARPERNTVLVAGACQLPATIIEPAARGGGVTAVVFHGLSANRRLMTTLGQSLAWSDLRVILVDLPGHGDSTEPYAIARWEECSSALLDSLASNGEINLDRTVLIGHSLGGALAMHLADRVPVAATIAISPAPMVATKDTLPNLIPLQPPRRMPANLLILMAQLEPQRTHAAARKLIEMAGGQRYELEDFRQRRAARLIVAPYATHTSLLVNRRVWDVMDVWWRMATPVRLPTRNFFGYTLFGAMLAGLAGLALLFSLATRAIPKLHATAQGPAGRTPPGFLTVVLAWLAGAAVSAVLLHFNVSLRALHIFGGEVLASFLLVSGIVVLILCFLVPKRAQQAAPLRIETDWRAWVAGAGMGLLTMLAFSAWLGWQATDVWMNAPRWWRFALLVPLMLPYSFVEETALGWPGGGTGSRAGWTAWFRRYILFVLLRLIVLAALTLPWPAWNLEQILILLMTPYLVLFSLGQRLGADSVRRRSGSVAAAAIFNAILAAWFIASVFPITGWR